MQNTAPFAEVCEGDALKEQVRACLAAIFSEPELIPLFFTEDYRQITDGKSLDRAGFENHVRHVKDSTESVSFIVLEALRQGEKLADMHQADVQFEDGRCARLEVYMFASLREGRIASIHESTRLLAGEEQAAGLGSAVSEAPERSISAVLRGSRRVSDRERRRG